MTTLPSLREFDADRRAEMRLTRFRNGSSP
jgi:hypothetical protein